MSEAQDQAVVALVTGASRGIGAAIAQRLAADGLRVIGTATTDAGAAQITAALDGKGYGVVMRIESGESVDACYAELSERGDMPLVLVNNAGITADNLFMRMKDDEWLNVVNTNINGLFRVTKPVVRGMMKARFGRIINLSSVVARMGNPGQANYVASKSAVEGFSRSLAHELASRGITVNTVAPGFIQTDMTSELTEAQQKAMLERVPAGRMGRAEEVAACVAFLAGHDAGYITGATVDVNGGLHMS